MWRVVVVRCLNVTDFECVFFLLSFILLFVIIRKLDVCFIRYWSTEISMRALDVSLSRPIVQELVLQWDGVVWCITSFLKFNFLNFSQIITYLIWRLDSPCLCFNEALSKFCSWFINLRSKLRVSKFFISFILRIFKWELNKVDIIRKLDVFLWHWSAEKSMRAFDVSLTRPVIEQVIFHWNGIVWCVTYFLLLCLFDCIQIVSYLIWSLDSPCLCFNVALSKLSCWLINLCGKLWISRFFIPSFLCIFIRELNE